MRRWDDLGGPGRRPGLPARHHHISVHARAHKRRPAGWHVPEHRERDGLLTRRSRDDRELKHGDRRRAAGPSPSPYAATAFAAAFADGLALNAWRLRGAVLSAIACRAPASA